MLMTKLEELDEILFRVQKKNTLPDYKRAGELMYELGILDTKTTDPKTIIETYDKNLFKRMQKITDR